MYKVELSGSRLVFSHPGLFGLSMGTPLRSGFGTCDSYRSRLLSQQGGMEMPCPTLEGSTFFWTLSVRPAQGQGGDFG